MRKLGFNRPRILFLVRKIQKFQVKEHPWPSFQLSEQKLIVGTRDR